MNPELVVLDVSNNRLAGYLPLERLPNLVVFKAANNSFNDISSLAQLRNLETLDLSGNEFKYFPGLDAIGDLVKFHTLTIIDISNNSLIPKLSKREMQNAGITKTSFSAPSTNLKGVICSQMTFHKQPSVVFHYDADLFDYANCECDQRHFGSPVEGCFDCPPFLSTKSCGANALHTSRNYFASYVERALSRLESIRTQSCIVTPEQEMTQTTNCKGVLLKSAYEPIWNATSLEKLLKDQCEEGSDGRLCSRCICNSDKSCFFERGPICKKCARVLTKGQSVGLIAGMLVVIIILLTSLMFIVLKGKRTKSKTPWENLSLHHDSSQTDDEWASLITNPGDLDTTQDLKPDRTKIEYPALALFSSFSISAIRFFYLGTALSAHEYLFSLQGLDGIKYLKNNPWMKWSEAHALVGVSIPAILVFDLILPILFLLLCWKVRKTYKTIEISIYFGKLFETLSPSCFWWEIVNIVRKLGVALILRGFSPNALQSSFVVTVFAATLVAQAYLSPWKRRIENIFDTTSTVLLILSLHASRMVAAYNNPTATYLVASLDCIYAVLCVAVIIRLSIVEKTDYHQKLDFYSSIDRLHNIGSLHSDQSEADDGQ